MTLRMKPFSRFNSTTKSFAIPNRMNVLANMSSSQKPVGRRAKSVFQVTFSDQSMAVLNELPIDEQLSIVDEISKLTPADLAETDQRIGRLNRDGQTYYRVRVGDWRCYFEIEQNTLRAHYMLNRNTLADFVYRNRLPVSDETMAEQHGDFWKYLESLRKK